MISFTQGSDKRPHTRQFFLEWKDASIKAKEAQLLDGILAKQEIGRPQLSIWVKKYVRSQEVVTLVMNN